MKRKKTAYESREWKASDGAYGKADSVSPFACFSIVLIVGILIFGVVKVAPKIMAGGGGMIIAIISIIRRMSRFSTMPFGCKNATFASLATA